ncbi:MAG TPA: hypothetical protein PKE64_03150 [Anaerolineae bacterium]|nr:hypothetical protein [Anaerolineae bacterium]HMR62985.1 hypothetical protein [Anaerolineae bacterium]
MKPISSGRVEEINSGKRNRLDQAAVSGTNHLQIVLNPAADPQLIEIIQGQAGRCLADRDLANKVQAVGIDRGQAIVVRIDEPNLPASDFNQYRATLRWPAWPWTRKMADHNSDALPLT